MFYFHCHGFKNLSHFILNRFVGQAVYVTHTLDLNEDVCAACFANRTEYILVGTASGEVKVSNNS